MWTCPQCSEMHEDRFDTCWQCLGGVNPNLPVYDWYKFYRTLAWACLIIALFLLFFLTAPLMHIRTNSERVNCGINLRNIWLILNGTPEHEKRDLLTFWREDFPHLVFPQTMQCRGYGAGSSSYLIVPAAMAEPEKPLILERMNNHLDHTKYQFSVIKIMSSSGYMGTMSGDGKGGSLSPTEGAQLVAEYKEKGWAFYNQAGQVDSIMNIDPNGKTWCIRFDLIKLYQIPLLLSIIFFIYARILRARALIEELAKD